jgi:hypothetical protein
MNEMKSSRNKKKKLMFFVFWLIKHPLMPRYVYDEYLLIMFALFAREDRGNSMNEEERRKLKWRFLHVEEN